MTIRGTTVVGWLSNDDVLAVRGRLVRRVALDRVADALAWRAMPTPPRTLLDRIAPNRAHRLLRRFPLFVPRGWAEVVERDRYVSRVLPLWAVWLVTAWHYRWYVLLPFVRVGLLEVREGDYWRNARPRGWKTFWTPERVASFRADVLLRP